jgi:alpha-tubulin suppressor-like RCC1 family protein
VFHALFALWSHRVLSLLMVAVGSCSLVAQDALRGWGSLRFATDANELPAVDIAAQGVQSAMLRSDGRAFVLGYGRTQDPPLAPPGTYTRLALVDDAANSYVLALLANGQIHSWGSGGATLPAPPLPPGLTYTQLVTSYDHAVALRSDGVAVAWGNNFSGQTTLPAVPLGATVQQVAAGYRYSLLRLSNGDVVACGTGTAAIVPSLPAGTTYVELWGGPSHVIARRSDGAYVSWGENGSGQGLVPTPPPGTDYATMALGGLHTLAVRSDGVVVAWGDSGYGQIAVPVLPVGTTVVQVAAGDLHSLLRLSNGAVISFGYVIALAGIVPTKPPGERWVGGEVRFGRTSGNTIIPFGSGSQPAPPVLPSGLSWLDAVAGYVHFVALRSDGRAVAWGGNSQGESAIPPLPPGLVYTAISAGSLVTALLRSDDVVVACGNYGIGIIPTPPPGTHYVAIDRHDPRLLLRSDDVVVDAGATAAPPTPLPAAGTRYVQIAATSYFYSALRSDGNVTFWGYSAPTLPPLPFGVVYVQVEGTGTSWLGRRSDGTVVTWSFYQSALQPVPELAPGESCVEVSVTYQDAAVMRVGPTRTYVAFAPGCAGSRPPARLVPRETPAIGQTLKVTLFDVPENLAILVWGWSRVPPISLQPIGMPGCAQHISFDAAVALAGQNQQAQFNFAIPDVPSLVGLEFHNQALVFDSAANPAGLVLSDAATGFIGHR